MKIWTSPQTDFIRQFSFLSAAITLAAIPQISIRAQFLNSVDWVFPMSLLPVTTLPAYWTVFSIIVMTFIAIGVFANKAASVALPLVWWFFLAFENSFGKINHHQHGFFFLIFGFVIGTILKRDFLKSYSLALASLFAAYFSSGLWKLRALINSPDFWTLAQNNLTQQAAHGIAEGTSNKYWVLEWLIQYPTMTGILWLIVILMQLVFPLLIIFHPRFTGAILFGFILFHVGGHLTVGPFFTDLVLLLFWLMVFTFHHRTQLILKPSEEE